MADDGGKTGRRDWHKWAASFGAVGLVVVGGLALFSNNKASVSGSQVQSGGSLFGSVTQNITNPLPPKPAAGSPEEAKAKLRDDGLVYSTDGFVEAVSSSTPDIVELYLDAGMSPNMINPENQMFVLGQGIMNNHVHAAEMVDLFKRHHVDFNCPAVYSADFVPLPAKMQDQLFHFALMGAGNVDAVKRLKSDGASPTSFVRHLQDRCKAAMSNRASDPGYVLASYTSTLQRAGVTVQGCEGVGNRKD